MVIKVGHRPGRSGSCSGVKGSCTFDVELTRCTQDLTLDVNDSVRNKTLVSCSLVVLFRACRSWSRSYVTVKRVRSVVESWPFGVDDMGPNSRIQICCTADSTLRDAHRWTTEYFAHP